LAPSHQWVRNFTITGDDLEYLTGLLLERETPLTTTELARALIEERLNEEATAYQERYKDVVPYNPAHSYNIGQKVIFSALDYQVATVVDLRPGQNPDYNTFNVIKVEFDDNAAREFAADLTTPHKLSQENDGDPRSYLGMDNLTAEDILQGHEAEIVAALEEKLRDSSDLVAVAGLWFPRSLILEVNQGHLNLAEAVLDISGGGPMSSEQILQEIGGLGRAPHELQVFSLNYALNQDERFDEVGPTGSVMWYLTRVEPPEVQSVPQMLRYTPFEYDRSLLTLEMIALEAEIDDELSAIDVVEDPGDQITITLNYPHRRVGTLPLNAKMRTVFPTARRTPRIWVRLVDAQDGEEYEGWVVRKDRYVLGLAPLYRKHRLPVGAFVTVHRSASNDDQMVVDFRSHRPRTEWIRLIIPKNGQITFENQKRSIGAEYDELMILGADDLTGVDAMFQANVQQRKSLSANLRTLITELGRLTPQGTVHFKTLYSALNVLRRCPPGPIFTTLVSNPDFEHVGNHYWRLT
jgi:hypothetical protein